MPDPYDTQHQRIRAARGKATARQCVGCDRPAEEWSLVHEDQALADFAVCWHDSGPRWFSPLIEDYEPRCTPCHRTEDARRERERVAQYEDVLSPPPYVEWSAEAMA